MPAKAATFQGCQLVSAVCSMHLDLPITILELPLLCFRSSFPCCGTCSTFPRPGATTFFLLTWGWAGSQGRAVYWAAVPHGGVPITGTSSAGTLGSQLGARALELGVAHNAGTTPDVFALAAGV